MRYINKKASNQMKPVSKENRKLFKARADQTPSAAVLFSRMSVRKTSKAAASWWVVQSCRGASR
jgi:hypothetical protein